MAKQNNNWILIIIGLVIAIIIGNNLGLFSLFQQTTIQGFTQWTGIVPNCWNAPSCAIAETLTYTPIVQIDTGKNVFRFEAEVKDIIEKKQCKSNPDRSLCSGYTHTENMVPTYIDSDGCQHWSYDIITAGLFEAYWNGPCTSTTNGGNYYCWWDNGCQCGEHVPGYAPRACSFTTEHVSDYGGAEIVTADSSGNIFRGCFQKIKVYKNNILIDNFTSEPTNNYAKYKVYFDSGNTGSGVSIDSAQSSWFTNPICSAFQNAYNLVFSNDSFTINISTPKGSYMQGENISLDVNVKNNLNSIISATLNIDYEVPTIIGTKTATESKSVTISPGDNLFKYTVPTTEPVSVLRVKPRLVINYPTNKLSGLNYNFGTQTLYPISAFSQFQLETVEEDWKSIQIIPQAVTPPTISREQLHLYIDQWINNQIDRSTLGNYIQNWANETE